MGSETGQNVAGKLPQKDEWLVPTIVQSEPIKGLPQEAGEEKAEQVIAFTQTCIVADLNSETAISAAEFSRTLRLATADAIIYATARVHTADILTSDAHFKGLDGVTFIPKHVL